MPDYLWAMNNYLKIQNIPVDSRLVSKSASTAKAILSTAQTEAEQILHLARLEALEIVDKASKERKLAEQQWAVSQRVAILQVWRKAVLVAKDDLLSITETIAKSILSTEISQSPDSILNRIEIASEIFNDLTESTIELSDAETPSIRQKLIDSPAGFKLKTNQTLQTGEFLIRNKRAEIKSSPQFHLEHLIKAISGLAPSYKQLHLSITSNQDQHE